MLAAENCGLLYVNLALDQNNAIHKEVFKCINVMSYSTLSPKEADKHWILWILLNFVVVVHSKHSQNWPRITKYHWPTAPELLFGTRHSNWHVRNQLILPTTKMFILKEKLSGYLASIRFHGIHHVTSSYRANCEACENTLRSKE